MTAKPYKPGLLRRMFTFPNVMSVVAGIVTFAIVIQWLNSNRGAVIAALISGAVSAAVWLIWNRVAGLRPVHKLLDLPQVGTIPPSKNPAPTLTATGSSASDAYQVAASRLEATTQGRVLLVSGIEAGQGATTAALNLAVAATRSGRRTLLIDGDVDRGTLSRFGGTGTIPGLTDLATGSTDLAGAARLWSIDATSRLPFIPSGTAPSGTTVLDRVDVAGSIEDVATTADLVLIDTAATNGTASHALGALADGTLLVLPAAALPGTVTAACERANDLGAPPVGYLVNEAAPAPASINQHPILRSLKRALSTAALVLLAYSLWNGFQIWDSWASVEREGFDTQEASSVLPLPEDGIVIDEGLSDDAITSVTAPQVIEGEYFSMLVIGSDLSGSLADVIMLAVIPSNGDDPLLVSLPRDLYLPNRCTQTFTKINASLAGCGDDVNGPTLLALAVEDFTGIPIDHFAVFTFEGFEEIIDEVGGIEVCLDYPVRDSKSDLDLPAGCTQATGAQALSWVRSRRTQELVDGRWRTMSDVSDLTRNERQQEVLLEMFAKLREFTSPTDLTGTVRSLANAFTLDDQLGITDAISIAWSLRGIDPTKIVTFSIPVADERTASGAAVLVPTTSFDRLLAEDYPLLAPSDETVSLDVSVP